MGDQWIWRLFACETPAQKRHCEPVECLEDKQRRAGMLGALTIVFVIAALLPAATCAQQEAAERVFAKVSPSVVVVFAEDASGQKLDQGSGEVIGAGQVITNWHVVKEGTRIEVQSGEKAFAAKVEYGDPDHDLCQLQVDGLSAPVVTVGSVKTLKAGESVFAVGAPEGLELTISAGIVSSLRPIGKSMLIQTSAPISPGSSGGGLYDADGRLVGITAFQFIKGQNLNFALPADWIAEIAGRSRSEAASAQAAVAGTLDFLTAASALAAKSDWDGLARLARARAGKASNDEIAWFCLGRAYDGLGQYDKAVEAEKQAIQLQPGYADAWMVLGLSYCLENDRPSAIQVYQTLQKLDPQKANTLFNACIVP